MSKAHLCVLGGSTKVGKKRQMALFSVATKHKSHYCNYIIRIIIPLLRCGLIKEEVHSWFISVSNPYSPVSHQSMVRVGIFNYLSNYHIICFQNSRVSHST